MNLLLEILLESNDTSKTHVCLLMSEKRRVDLEPIITTAQPTTP
ncbi:MAG: hypothetical protein ACOVSW_02735 [Candidatus Kapaibacteriota bacterium]